MKISITKLEAARKNPNAFAISLKIGETGQKFGNRSKITRIQDCVNYFHKTDDLAKTIKYFTTSFSKYVENPKNKREQEQYFDCLNDYINEFKKKKYEFLKKENLKIELNEKVTITGQIPLIFKNKKDGYSIYFFAKTNEEWETELRFPIVQNYFSDYFGIEIEYVEVGIFSTAKNRFYQTTFSEKEVSKAKKELETIGKTIFDIL